MLIIRAFVNDKLIDSVWIQNIGNCGGGWRQYTVRKPDRPDIILTHYRPDGWRLLARRVLEVLEKEADDGNHK